MKNEEKENEYEVDSFEAGIIEDPTVETGAINGNFPAALMQQMPCSIGFTYIRYEVDGSVKPCCVAPYPLGNINTKSSVDIWHSSEYNVWRAKFLSIHKKKFHLHDREFAFCQICPHIPMNTIFVNNLTEDWGDN